MYTDIFFWSMSTSYYCMIAPWNVIILIHDFIWKVCAFNILCWPDNQYYYYIYYIHCIYLSTCIVFFTGIHFEKLCSPVEQQAITHESSLIKKDRRSTRDTETIFSEVPPSDFSFPERNNELVHGAHRAEWGPSVVSLWNERLWKKPLRSAVPVGVRIMSLGSVAACQTQPFSCLGFSTTVWGG